MASCQIARSQCPELLVTRACSWQGAVMPRATDKKNEMTGFDLGHEGRIQGKTSREKRAHCRCFSGRGKQHLDKGGCAAGRKSVDTIRVILPRSFASCDHGCNCQARNMLNRTCTRAHRQAYKADTGANYGHTRTYTTLSERVDFWGVSPFDFEPCTIFVSRCIDRMR